MSSRLKRVCKMCNKKANLSFDPKKMLCSDCLIVWRDDLVKEHRAGKIPFGSALDQITKRCKMTEKAACDLLFPPIGNGDFYDDRLAMNLHFDPEKIKVLEAMSGRHEDE